MIFFLKKLLLSILSFIAVAGCVWLFPYVAKNSTTFAQMLQDKEVTLEKFKTVWNNNTIIEINAKPPEFEIGEKIGTLTIPRMNIYEMPIYYGEDDINNNWQITAPGKHSNWGIFGSKDITALGGHNYQLFHDLPSMQIGDRFIVDMPFDTFVYEVTGSDIYVHGDDDFSDITTTGKEPYSVDLLTCYPIAEIVTDDMYIVYTKMIKGTKFLQDTVFFSDEELEQYNNNKNK